MKTIIVATDFSAGAENATIYACNFAAQTGSKIILFHLYEISIHALNARVNPSAIDEMLSHRKNKLTKKAAELADLYKINVLVNLSMGDFQEELQHAIDDHQADIVVMGMAEKSMEQDLLGNTTTAAVHSLKFPVLAIPVNAVYNGLKNILFACDITRGVHKILLEQVRNILLNFGATIEIFHVRAAINRLENNPQEITTMQTFGEGLDGTNYFYKTVESNKVVAAIQEEIVKVSADLLIMVPYRHGFWGSLVHRSKTRIMASGGNVPLLSLPL